MDFRLICTFGLQTQTRFSLMIELVVSIRWFCLNNSVEKGDDLDQRSNQIGRAPSETSPTRPLIEEVEGETDDGDSGGNG